MCNVRVHLAILAGVALLALVTPQVGAQTVNTCQSKKKLCVAKKQAALLKCHEKAEKTGAAVDGACLQKAMDKFDGGVDPTKGCFAKLEAKGGCLTINDGRLALSGLHRRHVQRWRPERTAVRRERQQRALRRRRQPRLPADRRRADQ